MRRFLTLLIMSFATLSLYSQQTGSFDTTIPFMGAPRTLSMYVPEDYNPNTEYRLFVSLHGLGDNSTNLRNTLIGANFQNEFPNTIMVFVDGGNDNPNRGHIDFEGEEQVVYEAIDYVADNYTIDQQEILLHGFSFGARSALKIGLDDPESFKSLYLSTPAIQGYNDLMNEDTGPLNANYAYENASRIPIVITVGQDDITYFRQNIGLFIELAKNDGIVTILPFQGEHTLLVGPNNAQILSLLDEPNSIDFGVQFFFRDGPRGYYCSLDDLGTIYLRNVTGRNINSMTLSLKLDDTVLKEYTIDETMIPYQSAIVDVDDTGIDLPSGDYVFTLEVTAIDGEPIVDESPGSQNITVNYSSEGTGGKIIDDRTGTNDLWVQEPSFYTFQPMEGDLNGRSVTSIFNHPFFFHQLGHANTYYSPIINLQQLDNPLIGFDYSFAYASYDLQDGGVAIISDTLIISYKGDCDGDWIELARYAGDSLATYGPIQNSNNLNSFFVDPQEEDFDRIEINLSNIDSDVVQFKMDYMSGTGGYFNLDRIEIGQVSRLTEYVSEIEGLKVFPNPAVDFISIDSEQIVNDIKLIDLSGRTLIDANSSSEINMESLPSGTYILTGETEGKKFAKQIQKK